MANTTAQYAASGALTGAGTGAAIGSAFTPVGTAVGGVIGAGLGALVGLVSGKSAEEALAEEEARQAALKAEADAVDYVDQLVANVAGAGALSRQEARVSAESEANRLGLTGAQRAEKIQRRETGIDSAAMGALASAMPAAVAAETAEKNAIYGREQAAQELVDATMAAQGGEIEMLGALGGTAVQIAQTSAANKQSAAQQDTLNALLAQSAKTGQSVGGTAAPLDGPSTTALALTEEMGQYAEGSTIGGTGTLGTSYAGGGSLLPSYGDPGFYDLFDPTLMKGYI